MIVFFQAIRESEALQGELPYAAPVDRSPAVGDLVSLGSEKRWTIAAVDVYEAATERIYVAHCAVNVDAMGDRSTWPQIQRCQSRSINLQLFFDGDRMLDLEWNLIDRSPQIGEVLPAFDVAAHRVYPLPWKVATVKPFKPIANACYTAVYLAECEHFELAATA